MFIFEWFSCPEGIPPNSGLTGLNNTYIYIYIYIIQGVNPRGRSIQFECSILTTIDVGLIDLGLMMHQHSTCRDKKKSFYIKTERKKNTFLVSL